MTKFDRSSIEVLETVTGDDRYSETLELAASVLGQDRYIEQIHVHALGSHVLTAYFENRCVGFLRYLIQIVGSDAGRPAVLRDGSPLTEGYVEAFGVTQQRRRVGVGSALQADAAQRCRTAGCLQMRSRSPVTSTENYALKLAAGYTIHPSHENDSYYFTIRL